MNAHCPVMQEEKVKRAITTTYKGRVVGFCCEKCLAKFNANPERYVARMAAVRDLESPSGSPDRVPQEHAETQPAHSKQHHPETQRQISGGDERQESGESHRHAQQDGDEPTSTGGDHEHKHGEGQGLLSRLVAWMGKFHPAAVNFPIAMLTGAALAELLLIATRRQFFANAGRFCLWVGSMGAVVAGMLGWFFGGFHLVDDSWVLTTHRWLGTFTAAWSIVALTVGERTSRRAGAPRAAYRAVLFTGAGAVALTGFFGGAMIYGLKHYAL